MSQIPLQCEICQKYFSGPTSAQQHFESIDHQRKATANRLQTIQGSSAFFCTSCNKQCNSSRQFEEHCASPLHLAVVERAQRFASPAPSPAPQARAQVASQIDVLGEDFLKLTVSDGASGRAGMQSYVFDGTRGYCNVCALELTSHAHARQHLNGEKHKKKERQFVQGTLGGNLSCSVCQVPFSGPESAQQHLASDKHRKKVAELQSPTGGMRPATPSQPDDLVARAATPTQAHSPPPPPASWLAPPQTPPAPPQRTPAQPQSPGGYSFDGTRGHCHVCEIELTSPQHARQHLAGKNHKKKAERKSLASAAPIPLYCQICRVHFPDQMSAQSHYMGENHRLRESQLQRMTEFPGTPQATPQETEDTAVKMLHYAGETTPQATPQETEDTAVKMLHYAGETTPQATPKETEDTAAKMLYYARETTAPGMKNALSGAPGDRKPVMTSDGEQAVSSNHLATSQPADCDPSHQSNGTPAVGADPDETCVMNIATPRRASVGGTPAPVTPRASHLNHAVPFEFTSEGGLNCYACGGQKIVDREAIAQHLRENSHNEKVDEWINSKLSQPEEQRRSSPPAAMESPGGPSQRTPDMPVPPTSRTPGSPDCNLTPAGVASSTPFSGGTGLVGTPALLPASALNLPGNAAAGNDLSCMICVEKFSGPVPRDQHNASERHRRKVEVWNLLQNLPASADKTVRPVYLAGDLTPWYPCDVCLTLMNTADVLQKHKESPKHREQVEKREQFMSPVQNLPELVITQNPNQASSPPEQTPLTADPRGENSEVKTKEAGVPPEDSSDSASPGRMGNSPAISPSTNGMMQLISQQLKATKTFPDLIPPSQPPVAPDPAHSSPSFTQLRNPPDSDDEKSVVFDGLLESMTTPSDSLPGKSGTNPGAGLAAVVEPEINSETPLLIKPRFATPVPGMPVGEGGGEASDTASSGHSGASKTKPKPYNPLKNRSRGARGLGAGIGEEGDSSGEEDGLVNKFTKISLGHDSEDSSVNFESLSSGPQPTTSPTSQPGNAGLRGLAGGSGSGVGRGFLGLTDSTPDVLDQPGSPPLPPPAVLPGAPFGTGTGAVPRPFPNFKYYCETCKRPMNTRESYEAHMKGQGHKQKVASQAAPERDLGLSVKEEKAEDTRTAVEKGLIHMTPRSYQVELFCKAMASNCIIFLPTGTGKTVIAAMLVSHMLSLNPRRPVLFLVDKVLLVLQQGQVIARELKDKEFLRPDLSNETKVVHRKPRIAPLCGGLRGVDGIPLFQHDVIVTTAAYCENMLAEGIIRWEDFSLVVLDEAHHCVGRHPYCNIMRTRHLQLPKEKRPKVLGLTASPAGKNTLEDTITMLKNLMKSLGRARLGIVEGEQEREELDQYQSKTKITILKAELSHEEKQLCKKLKEYIVRCYLKLAEVSDIKSNAPIFSDSSLKKSPEEAVQLCAKEVDEEALKSFIVGLMNSKSTQKPKERAMFDYLLDHAQFTIITLQGIEGGAGVPFAVEEFSKLSSSDKNKFDVAEQYGLPARELMNFVEKLERVAALEKEMEAKGLTQVTLFGQLRHVLFSNTFVDWSQSERPMVLVLVRERLVAIRLSEALQRLDEPQKLGLRIHHVVGHGLKAEDGMRVPQQKRVLDGMRGRKYHIVVATSVAEEGVDVPECELVVTLNPPDSVTALVQMRGRARKQGSNFVVICEGEEKKQKLEVLLKREKNMAEAAKRCLHYSQVGHS